MEKQIGTLTVEELAARLKVQPHTLACWRSKGHGPSYLKLHGRGIAYRLQDVETWEQSRVRRPGGNKKRKRA